MNVFDFDNTIYDGESVVDFFLYYCKKDKSLLKYIPSLFKAILKYKQGKITVEQALSDYGTIVSDYLKSHGGIDEEMKNFWDTHMHKIKPFRYINYTLLMFSPFLANHILVCSHLNLLVLCLLLYYLIIPYLNISFIYY